MTFFYSSIGILLFSGIFLISKHTLLFSNKTFYSNYYNSSYFSSKAQQVDQYLLNLLENKDIQLGFNDELCYQLKSAISTSGLVNKNDFKYKVFPKTNSSHPKLTNSCILTNGLHRVLIKRGSENLEKYIFSSCLLSKNLYCSFEENY